jgi:putative membrane protein
MSLVLHLGAVAAALVHVLFFLEESVWWMKPAVHQKTFGLTLDQARACELLAFNQGFYNLFLAAGVALGLAALALGHVVAGRVLVAFTCSSMLAAALVLLGSKPRFWLGAIVQGLPPLVALAALVAVAR